MSNNKAWYDYQGYFLDLDGTLFHGTKLLPYADTFVQSLRKAGKTILFLTNNSTRTPEAVAQHLNDLNLPAKPEEVFTSAMASAAYIVKENRAARVHIVGEQGLEQAMLREGLAIDGDNPTHVVVGLDRKFTYEKLKNAASAIRKGAAFMATNTDKVLVTEEGFTPGSGSIVASVETASGQAPIVIGKPEKRMIDLALQKVSLASSECIMVGDNLQTDIAAGYHGGLKTLFVATGVCTMAEANASQFTPTWLWESLEEGFKDITRRKP